MIQTLKKIWIGSPIFKSIDKNNKRKLQDRLVNNNFSILCPNCVGGVIYNRLNQRFLSPTLNVCIDTQDFCKFINNLDYYINCEMQEYVFREDGIPQGIIDDVVVSLVHYSSFEEGKNAWDRRKHRINAENLFLIMYDLENMNSDIDNKKPVSDYCLQSFYKFPCKNKIMLTSFKNRANLDNFLYIEPEENKVNPLVYMNRDIFGVNYFEKHFDFVSFLNK